MRVEIIIWPFCEAVFVKRKSDKKRRWSELQGTSKWKSLHLIFIFLKWGRNDAYNLCKLYCKMENWHHPIASYIYICICIYIHVCTYIHIYLNIYMCMYVNICICVYVCVYVYICIYINTCVYANIYIYVHICCIWWTVFIWVAFWKQSYTMLLSGVLLLIYIFECK